ncbi:hapless 2-like [Octodon degus]|uniref:Hapless 2-like n=1 Tax=Octodon degus TaxID=10160 RepID=A0A6P6EY51_OCTDE|nr:hapless 2-like [Octodon degus]
MLLPRLPPGGGPAGGRGGPALSLPPGERPPAGCCCAPALRVPPSPRSAAIPERAEGRRRAGEGGAGREERGGRRRPGGGGGGGGRGGGGGGGGGGPRCRWNGKFDKSLQRPEKEGAGRSGGPAPPPPAPSPDEVRGARGWGAGRGGEGGQRGGRRSAGAPRVGPAPAPAPEQRSRHPGGARSRRRGPGLSGPVFCPRRGWSGGDGNRPGDRDLALTTMAEARITASPAAAASRSAPLPCCSRAVPCAIRPSICPSNHWCIHQCQWTSRCSDSPSRTTPAMRSAHHERSALPILDTDKCTGDLAGFTA